MADLRNKMSFSPEGSDTGGSFAFVEDDEENQIPEIYKSRHCQTCFIFRPALASHCAICDQCVNNFDHHCFIVNNCVGKRNFWSFVVFLNSTVLLCLVYAYCYVFILIKYQIHFSDEITFDQQAKDQIQLNAQIVFGVLFVTECFAVCFRPIAAFYALAYYYYQSNQLYGGMMK